MDATPASLPCSTVSRSASRRSTPSSACAALLAAVALWGVGCAGSKPPAAAPAAQAEAKASTGTSAAALTVVDDAEDPVPDGPLSAKAIEKVIQGRSSRFQPCYDAGLKKNPSLRGQVMARIVIGNDGRVAASEDGGSSMPDASVVKCVLAGFKKLRFPLPEESYVTVNYPMQFEADPGERGGQSERRGQSERSAQSERSGQGEQGATASVLKSGPFQGCSVAAGSDGQTRSAGASGTKTEIECGSRKLVVLDVQAEASNKAALRHLSRFEESISSAARPKRSSPKLHGRSSWVTVVQDQGKSWNTMVVLAFGKEKTRVVECSGKPNGISRWCERQITALARGYSPSGLLYGK